MADVILAVDPGKTSGLIEFSTDYKKIWVGYQMSRMDLLNHVEMVLDARWMTDMIVGRILVVSEQFIITPMTSKYSQQTDALKINGTLEWLCQKYKQTYEEQSQSTAKKIAKDKRLWELGILTPNRDHANDAARHLVLALERHMPSVFEPGGILGYNPTVEIERMS